MASISLYEQARELERQLTGILSFYDIDQLPVRQRELVAQLRRQLVDARLDVRDYEYAETRADQLKHAKDARRRFAELQKIILTASEYNVFGAVDVAQLTARIEQLISAME